MDYNFFYSNGLVICALISLIILGISYSFRIKNQKLDRINITYIAMFFITLSLIILEFIIYFITDNGINNLSSNLIIKTYIALGFVWNVDIILYVLLLIEKSKENPKLVKISYIISLSLIAIYIVITIIEPITYEINQDTKIRLLDGNLNTIYSYSSLISNALLLLIIAINSKKLSKTFVTLTFTIFGFYIANYVLEKLIGYTSIDSVFTYSLLVFALYYTTESQDKLLSDTLMESKQEAERLDDLKTKFVLNISHEIRTPLNTILGYSELLLLEDKINSTLLKENGTEIYQSSTDLLELINNILDVSRIESGNEKKVDIDYKLETLIFEVNSKISPRVNKIGNTKFTINIDNNLPANYFGDIQKIQRIVLSLLYNAIEYTSFGEIVLDISGTTNQNGTYLQFLISNTGHAMKEEYFNLTFDDIASIDAEKAINSNVLGIIISKSLANILDGELIFKNEVNQGTKYYFKILQKNIGNEKIGNIYEKIENLKGEKTLDCTGKRALVVDDNIVNLKIAKKLLDRFNFETEMIDNGQEAINKIKDNKFDIIFLDHMMPIMDGVQTLNNMKATYKELPPIIALTANLSDECRNEYMAMGFDDYLSKPIDFKEMNKIIKKFLEK